MRAARGQGGVASVETIALLPLLLVLGLLVLQVAVTVWAATGADLAARQAARARSLGRDPLVAAQRALPGGLSVDGLTLVGGNSGVTVRVAVPRVSPLPAYTISRKVELP
ncbi:MAG TPA: TadE/TadG family type IV pilus assembly protein [Acidimicrobiales bacterium]|nr:TadE/TadG family type IV pilus assembly protein [Acidimicrobiales bacterium]